MIPVKVLAVRYLANVSPALAEGLGAPKGYPSLGLITTDSDDATYIALDAATKAAEVEVRVQPVITIFSQGPYSLLPFEFLRQIQSSAQVTWQPRILTFVQWSGSIPSLLATSRGLRILIFEMRTSSQPAG